METKKIKTALISVYNKALLPSLVQQLKKQNIKIISTGGTADYLKQLGLDITEVEQLTDYPSILDGRVKTLHPKIFGGILQRGEKDKNEVEKYGLIPIDLVVVDLYPFRETLMKTKNEDEIIEKIDIGGISLIRAAAKNYKEVVVIPSAEHFEKLNKILENGAETTIEQRRELAAEAFKISSDYDVLIYHYFAKDKFDTLKISVNEGKFLRYGENPHQKAKFFGNYNLVFEQISGKEISYNNLLDIDGALNLISEFEEPTVAIIKHTNACGVASREEIYQAWKEAFDGDPKSAFGGIIVMNRTLTKEIALDLDKIFYEVVIAPDFENEALEILKKKSKRIILKLKRLINKKFEIRTAVNGFLMQETDNKTETKQDLRIVTKAKPTERETEDLIFANKIVKHTKSNAIVLVKNKKLIGSGMGLTSRVDALRLAIMKAKEFNHDLKEAVLASDAFLPFDDVVRTAHENGITAVIQPGGSIRDKDSIDFCNSVGMKMVFTGTRHFKH